MNTILSSHIIFSKTDIHKPLRDDVHENKYNITSERYYMRTLYLSCSSTLLMYKLLGNLLYLEEERKLTTIDTYSGSGLGTIISFMIASGHSTEDIVKRYKSTFNTSHETIQEMSKDGKSRLTSFIDSLTDVNLTLFDFFLKTGSCFVIPVYDLESNDIILFNHRDHPDVTIRELIMMSLSTPYDDTKYCYVELVCRYPIELLSSEPVLSIIVIHNTMTLYEVKRKIDNITSYVLDDEDEYFLVPETIELFLTEGYMNRVPYQKKSQVRVYKYPKHNFKQV